MPAISVGIIRRRNQICKCIFCSSLNVILAKYVSYLISVSSENEKKFREVRELSLSQIRIDLICLSILTLLRKLFIYCWRFHNVAKVGVPDFAPSCHVLGDKDVMVTIKGFITGFYSKPCGIMGCANA